MRSSKILIFKMLLVLYLIPSAGWSQSFYLRSGIVDFTNNTTREFYKLAVAFSAGADVWNPGRIHLRISSGLAFNSVRYNGHRHNLYMVPVIVGMNYDLMNQTSKICPTIGIGLVLIAKADQNVDFEKTFLALAYGYQATGGVKINLKQNLVLTLDLAFNLILPPDSEELNMSGVITMVGIAIPLTREH